MIRFYSTTLFSIISGLTYAQVGINTAEPKSSLEIVGYPTNNTIPDGIIPPKLTKINLANKINATYGSDQIGSIVYITDVAEPLNTAPSFNKVSKITNIGYHYWDGSNWIGFDNTSDPWTNITSGNYPGVYLETKSTGSPRNTREVITFLDSGRIGFGTPYPTSRLHISNFGDNSSDRLAKSQMRIESFNTGATPNAMLTFSGSRGDGSGATTNLPGLENDDTVGQLQFVAYNGVTRNGVKSHLTAAKLEVKFKKNENDQYNTANFVFASSRFNETTYQSEMSPRFSILGEGKVGVNSETPTTSFYVKGSIGSHVSNPITLNNPNTPTSISVLEKSIIPIRVSAGATTFNLADGVDGQKITIINNSNFTINNGTVQIEANTAKNFIYYKPSDEITGRWFSFK